VKPRTSTSAQPVIAAQKVGNNSAGNDALYKQLSAEIMALKKKNQQMADNLLKVQQQQQQQQQQQPQQQQHQQQRSVGRLYNSNTEEDTVDAKLAVAQKKRKLAAEELETAKAEEARKLLEQESQLQQTKLKIAADEAAAESARRNRALDDQERQRRYKQEDQQKEQDLQFAVDLHDLKILKGKTHIRMAVANQLHEQQIELIRASQQPGNLVAVLNKTHSHPAVENAVQGNKKVSSISSSFCKNINLTSSLVAQKREPAVHGYSSSNGADNEVLQKLMLELAKEKTTQNQLREEGAEEDNDDGGQEDV
jgi:hypothetical protein